MENLDLRSGKATRRAGTMSDQGHRVANGAPVVPGAQAIGRALTALWTVTARPEGVTATEVARLTNLPRPTVVRLLEALAVRRLVELNPATGRYEIGPGVLELAGHYLAKRDVRRVALPFLWELAEVTQETVTLAINHGLEMVIIEQFESPQMVRVVNYVGQRFSLHATANGRAWLASQPEPVIEALLARLANAEGGLPSYTEYTVTDPAALRRELGEIRRRGFAAVEHEWVIGRTSVAAPVFDHGGAVAATIAVSGPTFRLEGAQQAEVGALIVACAQRISAALGYRRSGPHSDPRDPLEGR